jgi:hypothetical protein
MAVNNRRNWGALSLASFFDFNYFKLKIYFDTSFRLATHLDGQSEVGEGGVPAVGDPDADGVVSAALKVEWANEVDSASEWANLEEWSLLLLPGVVGVVHEQRELEQVRADVHVRGLQAVRKLEKKHYF